MNHPTNPPNPLPTPLPTSLPTQGRRVGTRLGITAGILTATLILWLAPKHANNTWNQAPNRLTTAGCTITHTGPTLHIHTPNPTCTTELHNLLTDLAISPTHLTTHGTATGPTHTATTNRHHYTITPT